MKALTVWQPWATTIAVGAKLVENRGWAPSTGWIKPGDQLAIHAAVRKWSQDDALDVVGQAFKSHPECLPSDLTTYGDWLRLLERDAGKVVAVATLDRFVHDYWELEEAQRRWWVGPIGWVLKDVRRLGEPVSVTGKQGLWDLTPAALKLVDDQIRRAA